MQVRRLGGSDDPTWTLEVQCVSAFLKRLDQHIDNGGICKLILKQTPPPPVWDTAYRPDRLTWFVLCVVDSLVTRIFLWVPGLEIKAGQRTMSF